MKLSKRILLALTVASVIILSSCVAKKAEIGTAENPVKFFFIPSVDAKMLADKTKLVQAYLEKNTPYKYKIQVPQSYVAVVEAFGTNRADVASLNTFGYILANERYGAQARIVVMRFGKDTYQAQIVARTDSKIQKVEDIAGKKVAYVDPASTSGFLLPAKLFKEKNIKPTETVFANKHDNVITMVYQKQVDAGATFYSPPENGVIQDARRLVKTQFPDVESKIKIVQLTDEIPNDPMVFRKDLPEEMKEKITKALIEYIGTPEGQDTFHSIYGVTGLKTVTDEHYNGVRQMLSTLGQSANDLIGKK